MTTMKRYLASIFFAVLAILALVAGILAASTFSPAQEVTATGSTDAPFLTSREGLFGLYGDGESVKLEATTADQNQEIWIAIGSPADVDAWLEGQPYEEVFGLLDIQTLKMEPFNEAAQSGDQPESGAEEQPQSGEELESPIASDMWELERHGTGKLQMVISGDQMDKVFLAATNGQDAAPTITLQWDTPKANYASLFLFSFAALFALLSWLIVWRRQRRRAKTRAKLEAQIHADVTDTAMIPAVAAQPDRDESVDEAEVTIELEEPDQSAEETEVEPAEPMSDEEFAPTVSDQLAAEEEFPEVESESALEDQETEQTEVSAEEPEEIEAAEPEDVAPADDEPAAEEPTQDEPAEPLLEGEAFLDKTQQLTTDSGMINLRALQGGAKFPTRRALREAQARGIETLVIEGQEFSTTTGSIPVTEQVADETKATSALLGKRSLRSGRWSKRLEGQGGKDEDDA